MYVKDTICYFDDDDDDDEYNKCTFLFHRKVIFNEKRNEVHAVNVEMSKLSIRKYVRIDAN